MSPEVGVWLEGLPGVRPRAELGVEVSMEHPPQPPEVTEGPGTGLEDWQVDMCAPGQTQVGRCVLPSIVLARALVSHNSVNVSYREQVTEASFYLNIQLKCQKVISRIIVAYTF